MKMIGTISLNPTIDKTFLVEKLLQSDMNILEHNSCAAGKAINLAKLFEFFECSAKVMGVVAGMTGKSILYNLEQMGIANDFIEISGESRTNIQIIDILTKKSTFLFEKTVYNITPNIIEQIDSLYDSYCKSCDLIILTGALPANIPDDKYLHMINKAKRAGKTVFLDTSGKGLAEGIKANPDLIKPNEHEMAELAGVSSEDTDALIQHGIKLHNQGIKYVLLSLGEKGACLICKDGIFRGNTPQADALNTVGCGDSMVAAFTHAILGNQSPKNSLKFSLAAGAANTLSLEPASFSKENLAEMLDRCVVNDYI